MEKETRHRVSSFNESEDCYDEEKPKVSSEEIQSELENLPRISRIADFELTWNTNDNKNELNLQSKQCLDFLYSKIV